MRTPRRGHREERPSGHARLDISHCVAARRRVDGGDAQGFYFLRVPRAAELRDLNGNLCARFVDRARPPPSTCGDARDGRHKAQLQLATNTSTTPAPTRRFVAERPHSSTSHTRYHEVSTLTPTTHPPPTHARLNSRKFRAHCCFRLPHPSRRSWASSAAKANAAPSRSSPR